MFRGRPYAGRSDHGLLRQALEAFVEAEVLESEVTTSSPFFGARAEEKVNQRLAPLGQTRGGLSLG